MPKFVEIQLKPSVRRSYAQHGKFARDYRGRGSAICESADELKTRIPLSGCKVLQFDAQIQG